MPVEQISLASYSVLPNERLTDQDARVIGPVLDRLRRQGNLTASNVLREAEGFQSPLRPYFEWDNTIAARKYRLSQAEEMVRYVVLPAKERELQPAVAAVGAKSAPAPRPAWRTAPSRPTAPAPVQTEAHKRERALRELAAWEAQYGAFAQEDEFLRPVLLAVQAVRARLRAS